MTESFSLEILLTDDAALLEADRDSLLEWYEKHPGSLIAAYLLGKKSWLETGEPDQEYVNKIHQLSQNPGQAAGMLKKMKKEWQVWKKNQPAEKPMPLTHNIRPAESQPVAEIKQKTVKKKVEPRSAFTRWLLDLDQNLHPEAGGMEPKAEGEDLQLKDEILSESLASIYAAQGLIQEAVDMYKKLSLINPEKSAYFANLIEKLIKN